MVPGIETGYYPMLRKAGGYGKGYICICRTCGERWAKLEVALTTEEYDIINHPCLAHGRKYCVGGSLLSTPIWQWEFSSRAEFVKILPKPLLLLELNAFINHHERFYAL